ncbi:hypothetical protein [Streptomyces sp. NPDC058424]|uniref:hypothetical protein n=1 Tax=Streptomyces sp. NPDC058424 TaxID=3346491 RepID=UPI00364C83FE
MRKAAPITVDGEPVLGRETSVKQEAARLANAWKLWGERGGYFATPAGRRRVPRRDRLQPGRLLVKGNNLGPAHIPGHRG